MKVALENNIKIDDLTLNSSLLECAFSHSDSVEVGKCTKCKERADKIIAALHFWFCDPIRDAINSGDLKGRVTVLDLESPNGSFVTESNFEKLSTINTPQPLIFGYSKDAESPFLMIRFIDSVHNAREKIPSDAKSFKCLMHTAIPHVGLEPISLNYYFCQTEKGSCVEETIDCYADHGKAVFAKTVKLLKGELDGKKVM